MNARLKNSAVASLILLISIFLCFLSIYTIILIKKLAKIQNDHNLWILSIAINGLIIFGFLVTLQLYLENKKTGKMNWEANFKRNAFILSLVVAKTVLWVCIISILTSDKKNHLFGIIGLILLVSIILVHCVHAVMTKGLYKKFFVEQKSIEGSDGKSCKKIKQSTTKKIQYILCILLACVIFAIPMLTARLLVANLPELPISINIPLFGKEIAFLNGHNNMLFICVIDCLCLIFGFLLIGKLSDHLFIELNKKFDKSMYHISEEARNQFTEEIIKNINLKEIDEILKKSTLNFAKYDKIHEILNLKEKNNKSKLIILGQYFFDKDKRNILKSEINNLEKKINKIQDKNKQKVAKIAIANLRKNFYIVTKKDNVKSNLFKASVSVASTLCLHFLTHMHQSGAQFNFADWNGIIILAMISAIFLSLGLTCDMIAGGILKGKDGLFESEPKPLKNLKKNEELWEKIINWKEENQNHKQRCGCESGGMKDPKNKQVRKYQILRNKFNIIDNLNISIDELKKMNDLSGNNIFYALSDVERNILEKITIELNTNQIEEILNMRDSEEPCECCCIDKILKQMLEKDSSLSENEKWKMQIYLNEKELEKPLERKEMNNGGSCPCSSLAKADKKTVKDKLNEFMIDAILWQAHIKI
jgi:hypothetical protein